MKARRLFDADATDGYLLDGKYWIDPLIAGVKTNADKIRAMTDDRKLADFLYHTWHDSSWCKVECDDEDECKDCWFTWLEEEAKE